MCWCAISISQGYGIDCVLPSERPNKIRASSPSFASWVDDSDGAAKPLPRFRGKVVFRRNQRSAAGLPLANVWFVARGCIRACQELALKALGQRRKLRTFQIKARFRRSFCAG